MQTTTFFLNLFKLYSTTANKIIWIKKKKSPKQNLYVKLNALWDQPPWMQLDYFQEKKSQMWILRKQLTATIRMLRVSRIPE